MSASTVPPRSVGRALARISTLRGRPQSSAATGGSRAAILELLERAPDVLRVGQIADAVGLHANTVRAHLDALLDTGRVTRIPDERETRGRPHWLYRATATATMRELARALEDELDGADAPELARSAAAGWAEAGPEITPAQTPDGAVEQAVRALAVLGFDPVTNPVGDEITLRACPYAELAEEHPVICRIHAELLGEVLARTEQPVTLRSLEVFPRPGLCVARLDRPDVSPRWSIRTPHAYGTDPAASP